MERTILSTQTVSGLPRVLVVERRTACQTDLLRLAPNDDNSSYLDAEAAKQLRDLCDKYLAEIAEEAKDTRRNADVIEAIGSASGHAYRFEREGDQFRCVKASVPAYVGKLFSFEQLTNRAQQGFGGVPILKTHRFYQTALREIV